MQESFLRKVNGRLNTVTEDIAMSETDELELVYRDLHKAQKTIECCKTALNALIKEVEKLPFHSWPHQEIAAARALIELDH